MLKVRLPKLNKRTWIAVSAVVFLALGFSFFFFYKQSPEAEASWWNEDWRYRKKLTIDQTKIDADLTNFPVAVVLTSSNFTYTNAQSAGQDIRFTDTNGTPLSHEIEKWNTSATSTIWVKVPSVDSEVDTTIYMYYGNGSVADGQKIAEVWDDDFASVYHLNETPYCPGFSNQSFHYDSSKYLGSLRCIYFTGNSTTTADGILDGADFFDSANFSRLEGDNQFQLSGMPQFTLEAWVRNDVRPTGSAQEIIRKTHSVSPWSSYNFYLNTDGKLYFNFLNQNGVGNYYDGTNVLATSTWYHVVALYDGTYQRVYINGVLDGQDTTSGGSVYKSDSSVLVGSGGYWDGIIDEVRVQTTARSEAWIKASYESGRNNLITFAAEEKGPGPVAYWGFEEGGGTNITDLSGNGHTLIASSTVWKTESECKSGKCIYFDGATSVATTTNTDELNISGSEITLTGWFKPLTQSGKKMLLNKGSYAQHWNYGFGLNNAGLLMRHNNGDKTTTNVTINTNDWHQFTAVYSGGNDYFYIDGVLVESMSDTSWLENTGVQQLTLGAAFQDGVGYSEFFHGFLDEVKVYNYARTADQIRQDYNKGLSVSLGSANQYASLSDGLIGWWPMDEASWNGTSGEVVDMSGNSTTGTATNANTTSTAKFARAGSFDGDSDYVSLNNNAKIANLNSSSFTLAGWIRTTDITKEWQGIFDTDNSTNFFAIYLHGDVYAYTYIDGQLGNIQTLNSGANSIQNNTWYHIAAARDYQTGVTNLYVDGKLVDSFTALGNTGDIHTSLSLSGSGTNSFKGQLDDFRIYNRALSPDEVRRLSEWAPEPVSYWKFDEATGQNVYSSTASSTENPGGQGYLGTSVSEEAADPLWTLGKYGSALKFDATNAEQVYIPDPGTNSLYDFTTNDSISFALWVKPSVYGDNDGFINKGSANNENWGIEWEGTGSYNRLQFYFRRDDETGWSLYRTDQTIPLNEWSHIAVSYTFGSSTSIKMYVDGVLTTGSWIEGTGAETPDNDDTGIYIGRNPWGGEEFTGSIDDVRLYRYIRNSRQVLEDMNAGKKNNPIGYWSFDEGQGGTAYDNGYLATLGSGNNGTLTNMTTSGPSSVWLSSGKAGKALQFDGSDDFVAIPNNNITNYNQSRSVSLWFKTNTLGSQKGIIGTGATVLEDSPFWLLTQSDTNKISLYHSGYHDGITTLERNKWYHLVYTYDRERNYLVLYLDGKVEYVGTVSEADNDKANIYIGGGWGGYFNGEIDEVKIYNYPITVDEIRQNYNVGQQIVLSRSADNNNQTEGLVAYWPMDGNLTDASGNGNTGTASGATATSSAKFGQAYAIGGGTNYISAPTSASLDSYTDKLTVAGWYYINTMPGSQAWFFDKGNNYYLRFASNGAITNYLFGINNEDYWTTGSGLVTAGRWYYVVFTYNGQERMVYINGELKASQKDTGNVSTGGNFNIGNRNSHSEPMDGQVDDIKVYNRALSADEIAQNYVDGPKPVAYWKFDEGSGLTAYDSIGGNNLTLGYSTFAEPTWESIGKRGSTINLHGNTQAEAAGIDDANLSNDFPGKDGTGTNYGMSAMAWVKLRDNTRQDILCRGSGSWCFWVDDSSHLTEYATQIFGTTAVPANQWFHMAYTYDGQTAKLYLNGVLDQTKADTEGIPEYGSPFLIGSVGAEDNPEGLVDEVKVYNYARTQRQILEDMHGGGQITPVGYWKMDEGEGVAVKDYSGQANHGSLVVGSGGTQSATSSAWTNGANGKINSSLNFDGTDDRVNLGSVTTGENVTISAWIKTSTSSPEVPIFSNRGSGVYYGISGGKFFIYDNDASPVPNMNSNKTINDGNWHHVVWTSNGSSSVMYIDGELDSVLVQSRLSGSGTAYVAWDAANGTEYFPGQIDELKIWNYALTADEIKQEYNGGFSSFFR